MKKMLSILVAMLLVATTTTSVVACGEKNNGSLNIAFVSTANNGSTLQKLLKNFAPILKEEIAKQAAQDGEQFNKNINIKLSSDADTTATSLAAGTTNVAFLPSGTYQQYWGDPDSENGTHSKLGLLLQSTRTAPIGESTFFLDNENKYSVNEGLETEMVLETSAEYVKNYNEQLSKELEKHKDDEHFDYNTIVTSQNTEDQASYYRGLAFASKKASKLIFKDNNYSENLKSTLLSSDINVAMSFRKNSASGLVYQFSWLREEMGWSDDELKTLWNKKVEEGKKTLVEGGGIDVVFGFPDSRLQYTKDTMVQKQLLEQTKVIFATNPIINDGVSYSRTSMVDQNELKYVREAFEELIKWKKYKEIFEISQHSSYTIPENKEEEGEYDTKLSENSKSFQSMVDLMKDWPV